MARERRLDRATFHFDRAMRFRPGFRPVLETRGYARYQSNGQIPLWSGDMLPCETSVTFPAASISIFVMPADAQTMPWLGMVTCPFVPIEFSVAEPSG